MVLRSSRIPWKWNGEWAAGGASRSQVVGMAVGVMEGRGGGGKICGNLEELHLSAAPWGTVHDPSNHNPLPMAHFVEVVRRDWPVTWRFAVPWEAMQPADSISGEDSGVLSVHRQ